MPNQQIIDRPELTSADAADVLFIRDVSDTTDTATGTDKRITLENLAAGFADVFQPNTVATFADLPAAADNTGEVYVVQTTTGTWLLGTQKRAGWYRSNGTAWVNVPDNSDFVRTTATSGTDNRLMKSDGTTGRAAQETGVTVDDSNNVTGVAALTASGAIQSNAGLVVSTTGSQAIYAEGANEPYLEVRDTTNVTRGIVQAENTTVAFGTASNHDFRIYTNGTEAVRVDTSQRMGIGTSAPSSVLDVQKSQAADTRISVSNANTTGSSQASFAAVSGSAYFQSSVYHIGFCYFTSNVAGAFVFGAYSDTASIQFLTGASPTEKLRIANDGKVGIGTSSPDSTLTIGGSNAKLRIQPSNVADAEIDFRHGSIGNSNKFIGDSTGNLIIHANGAERMRIKSTGVLNIASIPTSSAGLASGDVWSDSGTLKIIP